MRIKFQNIKNYIKKIIEEEFDIIINESGYSRIANILRGYAPSVETIGIITAENPFGKITSDEYNKSENEKLEKELKQMNLGFIKVKGKYGNKENSFFVPNITLDEILNLGSDKKYKQETVIFGNKISETKDGKEYFGMEFQQIHTDGRMGEVSGKHSIFINNNDFTDYYSIIRGRKFRIPFFDGDYIGADWKKGSGIILKNKLSNEEINKLNNLQSLILEEGRTKKSRWINRGEIFNLISDIVKRI